MKRTSANFSDVRSSDRRRTKSEETYDFDEELGEINLIEDCEDELEMGLENV